MKRDPTETMAGSRAQQHTAVREVLIALQLAPSLGREQLWRLQAAAEQWLAGDGALAETPGLRLHPEALATARALVRASRPMARAEEQRATELGARIVTRLDSDYPPRLRHLDRPPQVLYVQGEIPRAPAIAIVGPRNADAWALRSAEELAGWLASRGAVIVSGFARGVDQAAHRAALDRDGGSTVAVLGCGLGVPYPRQHYRMAAEIAERGAVLSEFSIGRPPDRWSFPIRNRIIAALAAATVVVQASVRSGALITAREAATLGREVLAVPGRPQDARSRGANLLLRDGAQIVVEPRDVVEALPLEERETLTPPASAPAREPARPAANRELLALLREERATDELAQLAGLPVPELLARLSQLELDGSVERSDGRWIAVGR